MEEADEPELAVEEADDCWPLPEAEAAAAAATAAAKRAACWLLLVTLAALDWLVWRLEALACWCWCWCCCCCWCCCFFLLFVDNFRLRV